MNYKGEVPENGVLRNFDIEVAANSTSQAVQKDRVRCILFTLNMRSLNLLILSIFVIAAQAQQAAKSVVLPAKAATGIIATEGTWTPLKTDIDSAEANISQVASLNAEHWPS